MNIFNKVTLQSMKKNRTRTIVTIIGVILSAAMITAVAAFGVSLLSYMTEGAIEKYGDWHVEFVDVSSSFANEITHDDEIASTISFENIGYARLKGSKNPDKPYLFLAGFNDKTFNTLPIKLISGRMPENSGEVLVSLSVSANGGVEYSVGDNLSIAVGKRMNGSDNLSQHVPYNPEETLVPERDKNYTVVGICERPCFEEYSAPGYTLITKVDSQDKADSFTLFAKLTNPRKIHSYLSSTSESVSYILNDNVLRFMGLSDSDMFNILLYVVGAIVTAIIMVGSIFLIYNSFNISLNERTHQFGILSSIGATATQLRNSVLFEGLCIGAIGIPIGIIVGIVSINLVISIVDRSFRNILYSNVHLSLILSISAIIGAAAVSLVTILISAYIPARKAANTPVMESIRQTNEIKIEARDIKTSKLAQRIYGLEGNLALKNFKRNKKRYRSIVLSLILSIVLFISSSSFVIDLKQASEQAEVWTTYDIGIATQSMDDSEMLLLYDKVKTADSIYESSYQALMKYSCAVKVSDLSDYYWKYTGLQQPVNIDETVNIPMDVQFLDDSSYMKIMNGLNLNLDEYTGEDAKMISVAKIPHDMSGKRKEELAETIDMFKESSMNCIIASQKDSEESIEQVKNVSLTFVDVEPPDTLPLPASSKSTNQPCFTVIVPYSLKEKFEASNNSVAIKGLTFKSNNVSQSVEDMKTMIQEAGITSNYTLYNMNEILDQNRNIIFIVNVFTYIFIIMISLIAVANVFNTISTNIKLRRRELAMLRSIGMSDHDFQKMMNFECIFYGMKALIFGLPLSAVCSWIIYKSMVAGADSIDFVFPWASMIISIFSVFFVVFITMLYSISKIKKENIIDALRDDLI